MPGSSPDSIAPVVSAVWALAPKSVLDVGAGSGKFGALFREYLEARHSDSNSDYSHNRVVRIDAVEGFPAYIGDLHHLIYDNVYPMLVQDFITQHSNLKYDFIYAGDVIEHFNKIEAQKRVIPGLLAMSGMGMLISVPTVTEHQDALYGNELEHHRSQWTKLDFQRLAPYSHVGTKGNHLLAFLSKHPETVAKLHMGVNRRLTNVIRALRESW